MMGLGLQGTQHLMDTMQQDAQTAAAHKMQYEQAVEKATEEQQRQANEFKMHKMTLQNQYALHDLSLTHAEKLAEIRERHDALKEKLFMTGGKDEGRMLVRYNPADGTTTTVKVSEANPNVKIGMYDRITDKEGNVLYEGAGVKARLAEIGAGTAAHGASTAANVARTESTNLDIAKKKAEGSPPVLFADGTWGVSNVPGHYLAQDEKGNAILVDEKTNVRYAPTPNQVRITKYPSAAKSPLPSEKPPPTTPGYAKPDGTFTPNEAEAETMRGLGGTKIRVKARGQWDSQNGVWKLQSTGEEPRSVDVEYHLGPDGHLIPNQ